MLPWPGTQGVRVPVRRATTGDGRSTTSRDAPRVHNTSPRQSGNSVDHVGPRLFARDFQTKVRHSARLPSTFEGEVPARPHHSSRSSAHSSAAKLMWPRRTVVGSSSSCCLFGCCAGHSAAGVQDRRPQVQRRELPREVLEFVPERPVDLDRKTFFDSLRSAPRGSSAGPGGCTYEHLKLMLDDTDSQELLLATCNLLAQGKVLAVIGTALMGARLSALTKPNGGVREIATGCTVRRLVARTLAKQFMKVFEAECAPFQYALSTRAGTDCVGHLLRVLRSAMLGRLASRTFVVAICADVIRSTVVLPVVR